ncbi:MAG: beta-galactosidase [Acidobacteria bacterium]|nr:beta-galactosidase [Acidobacteriota bacterium]
MTTRREFLASGTAALAAPASQAVPWYRRTLRWGQTNITEKDPQRYDIAWWREYWKRTQTQGVILNAGGIVAYYPSKFPLHHRAEFLNGRDLYGELCKAAHEDGIVALARMDCNRVSEDFFRAHPDWFARTSSGDPYRAADKYTTCINSPYYDEYIPAVLTEIVERSHPEGFADNSWAGLGRGSICYCDNCARKFRDKTGQPLPKQHDWNSPVYRQWIEWNYDRRLEVWDLFNRTTKAAGGPDCLWIGMNSGTISGQARSFRDTKRICERAEMMLMDHQSRSDSTGFQQNAETGKLIHGLLGWDKIVPESMAMYQAGHISFRVASKPAAEARMWMIAGFAGGIQPWWHHVGAYHEDRRMYRTAEPLMNWFKANQQYLANRRPVAAVGLVWSQRNVDYYCRGDSGELVEAPYRGFMQALVRARIPYIPVHADHIARDGANLSVLALPNLAAMSDAQCAAVRRFAGRGGGIVATGVTSLYNEWGESRGDFALADLFGAHTTGKGLGTAEAPERRWAAQSQHSYLRLSPELRARVWGPKAGDEPPAAGQRHPVLGGFEETDILPYGGLVEALRTDPGAVVPLTFIPQFPIYPPETAWMRQPKTDIPALVLKGRVAYLPADIDRRFGRDNLPDHGNLIANLVRWAAGDRIPLAIEGRGLVDCNLYTQPSRVILHLVNLTSAGTWRAPVDELIPIGPLAVKVRLPEGVRGRRVRLLVAGAAAAAKLGGGWVSFGVKSVLDHEVIVIE